MCTCGVAWNLLVLGTLSLINFVGGSASYCSGGWYWMDQLTVDCGERGKRI